MKKALLSTIAIALLFAAAPLLASDWVGTYDGNDQGVIEGILDESMIPVIYEGIWESYIDYPHNHGTWHGEAVLVGNYYVVQNGEMYDDEGTYIGVWNGSFPAPWIDGVALGDWWRDNGWQGTWTAWRP